MHETKLTPKLVKNLLSSLRLILTLDCEQSSRIVSESLDRHLTLSERWAVRFHYIGCWSCRRFRKQVEFLREAVQKADELPIVELEMPAASVGLSDEARQRILDQFSDGIDDS